MYSRFYKSFPKYKALYGLVLDMGEANKENRYCWYPDTTQYRSYLIQNIGTCSATRIYVGWMQKWIPIKVFTEYAKSGKYESDKQKYIKSIKH